MANQVDVIYIDDSTDTFAWKTVGSLELTYPVVMGIATYAPVGDGVSFRIIPWTNIKLADWIQ